MSGRTSMPFALRCKVMFIEFISMYRDEDVASTRNENVSTANKVILIRNFNQWFC